MTAPTFRTDDGTRWGTGQGSDLSAEQIDLNFWDLYSSILALEDHQSTVADIDYITAIGDQMFIHLTSHRVVGPVTIPTSQWNFRTGGWTPATSYASFDVFEDNGSLYLVLTAHTSAATFDPGANDGDGHDLYALLLAQPDNALPSGGTPGQRLTFLSESPFTTEWRNEYVRLATTVVGQPEAAELIFRYVFTDDLQFPANLDGSQFLSDTAPDADTSWPLQINGAAAGSVDFVASNFVGTATFTDAVDVVPGDTLTLFGPTSPDTSQANVSFTFRALVRD